MIAIVKSDQRLTDADADVMRGMVQKELKASGLCDEISVIVLGSGMELALLGDQGETIFSTEKQW